MKIIEENRAELEYLNILEWWEKGYTGKGIRLGEIEAANPNLSIFNGKLKDPFGYGTERINVHGQEVLDVMHQVAPDADLYILPGGISIKYPYLATGSFIEKTIPFAIAGNVDIIGASVDGMDSEDIHEKIVAAQKKGVVFVCAAGNEGDKGLTPFAESGDWISVGAATLNSKGDIFLPPYSSKGNEIDFCSFSGIYVHDGNNPSRTFSLNGTSFSQPIMSGMIALVQQFFKEKVGRKLYQDEMLKFIIDNCIDLGVADFDPRCGHGLFILPSPEDIDIKKYLLYDSDITPPPIEFPPIPAMPEETIQTKYSPILVDGVTYMQVREIIEAAGGQVIWKGNNKPIDIYINGYKLTVEIGKKYIKRQDI